MEKIRGIWKVLIDLLVEDRIQKGDHGVDEKEGEEVEVIWCKEVGEGSENVETL